jgi:glycosyltransferase involved in cell wall biosynthesis
VAGRALGTPAIGAIRNDLFNELRASGRWGKWQLSLPQHLIANSELARQRAIDRGILPGRIDFLRNVVELKPIREEDSTCQCATIRISFVGRLVPQKRPDLFLRVAAKVIRLVPERNLKFTIAGDGPMRPRLETQAKELSLSAEQLVFLGTQTDMDRVYRDTDILVMTSDNEGTPNALLEAMASSIPSIATRVGGIPAILANGRGLLADPDNEDELVAAVIRLINDHDLQRQIGRLGREYVVESHSLNALGQQLTSIYHSVLSR